MAYLLRFELRCLPPANSIYMRFDFSNSLSRDVLTHSQRQYRLLSYDPDHSPSYVPVIASFRNVLRDNLPNSLRVSRGYICPLNGPSIFQEVIIHARNVIPLYEEGDLVYLRPEEAQVVVGVLTGRPNDKQIKDWITESTQIEHYMKQAENAQGLVTYWLESDNLSSLASGFDHWKKSMAKRNIPSLFLWGKSHCFCKHVNSEPSSFQWNQSAQESSPALSTLFSLIWYHLLEEHKASPFREWFPEQNWLRKSVELDHSRYAHPVQIKESGDHRRDISNKKERRSSASATQAATPTKEKARPVQRRKKTKRRTRLKTKTMQQPLKIHATDVSGLPVHHAVLSLNVEALNRCIDQKLDLNAKDKDGNTPIHLAAQYNLLELVQILIDGEADLNSRNFLYATPMHTAIENGSNEVIQELIEAGAELEARNNRARTPLHEAAMNGNREAAICLIDNFADIHALMEKDMQPLHLASWYGQADVVELLIERGANLNAVNSDGNTALHFAAFNGQVKVIKQLINHHADPSIPNHKGESYLQGINEGYSGEVIRVLE